MNLKPSIILKVCATLIIVVLVVWLSILFQNNSLQQPEKKLSQSNVSEMAFRSNTSQNRGISQSSTKNVSGTSNKNKKIHQECFKYAELSIESIQSLDPNQKLRVGEQILELRNYKSKKLEGFSIPLIDENTGKVAGLSHCVLESDEVLPYSAGVTDAQYEKYPPLSPTELQTKLVAEGLQFTGDSLPELVFVNGRFLSTPIYKVLSKSGSTAFYSGIDGRELLINSED